MLRIQRALLVEHLFLFVLVTFVVTSAVFLGVSLQFLSGGGGALGADLMFTLLPKLIPLSLAYAIPFSWLAATAMALGRWVADHECLAVQASGVHLRTMAAPLLLVGVLLSVGGMWWNGFHVPKADRDLSASMREFLPKFLSSLKGADRSISFSSGRFSFDHFDEETERFMMVEIDKRGGDGRLNEKASMRSLYLARVAESSGEEGLELKIERAYLLRTVDGEPSVDYADQAPFVMGHVQRIGASTLFNQFFGAVRYLYRPRNLTVSELAYAIERGGIARGSVHEAKIALHGRLALGAAAFFLGLFAMSMMFAMPPSGRRVRDFMLSFAPGVLLYFPLQMSSPSLARNSGLPPWLAMWSPNLVLLALSVVLLMKAFRR